MSIRLKQKRARWSNRRNIILAMNKSGLMIVNAYLQSEGVKYIAKRLIEEFASFDVALDVFPNKGAKLFIDESGRLINRYGTYDFCVYWDKDLTLSLLLEKSGLHLFNSAEAIRLCDDKSLMAATLLNQNIKMPITIPAPLNYVGKIDEDFLNETSNLLGFPLIAKESFGSLGKEVYLIKDFAGLVNFEKEHCFTNHLYQQFISSSFGKDYRLIIIGGKFVAGMLRENKSGDFRSNIACGAKGKVKEIPASYIALAEKVAQILDLDYCGVDLLIGEKEEPILCEVNSNAYLEGIEKVTSINVAKAYVKHIVNNLKS